MMVVIIMRHLLDFNAQSVCFHKRQLELEEGCLSLSTFYCCEESTETFIFLPRSHTHTPHLSLCVDGVFE